MEVYCDSFHMVSLGSPNDLPLAFPNPAGIELDNYYSDNLTIDPEGKF